MTSTVQQLRVSFARMDDENIEPGSLKTHRIPIQKGQSFKGHESSDDGEFEAAVAAAAYAITMLEEYGSKSHRSSEGIEITSLKHRNRKEDSTTRPIQPGGLSGRLSQKASKEDKPPIGDLSTTSASQPGGLFKIDSGKATKEDEQSTGALSTTALQPGGLLRRLSWKADKQPEEEDETRRPEIVTHGMRPPIPTVQKAPIFSETRKDPNEISNVKPTNAVAAEFVKKRNEMPYSSEKEHKAASWEKAKLADIKNRYEKVLETIRLWEDEKKKKAKSKLEKRQGELERKRERAITEYRRQMSMINKIASGARFQAEERRQNEEINANKKANKIRSTGEFPRACFCF
ncbi:remorin 1.4-like isoform X2 [Nymphaea colorata]|uniref:remorin 1.4-like isoform X2 n=1 Tax=Nymphaea colorata TaxID=210225 RepID=UPI00129D8EDA|nr:remorin 1.4-like isoform X2 [Nymphaea colorata]